VLPVTVALVYFGWHAVHGQRGLLAWVDLSRELELGRTELAELRAVRLAIERRVDGLRPDAINPDLLDEELRKLGYVGARELIILTPERLAPAER
jgi:cell division protein FtsB